MTGCKCKICTLTQWMDSKGYPEEFIEIWMREGMDIELDICKSEGVAARFRFWLHHQKPYIMWRRSKLKV